MPLGFERINARRKQPNDHINFIKPLDGPDKALAEDFLERVAAICNPIMKENHIYVMSLEEYEPNNEFVGRNFNAGEVIQLVLKAPSTGHWLPFRYVQMVMIHELSHCKQMNHSKAFWDVRNRYSVQLRALWGRGYTGEGMWSMGITLASEQHDRVSLDDVEGLSVHLCGGTFRTPRKRKTNVKNKLTYREREARRVAKKFGTNGIKLGAEGIKAKPEKGKKASAKPRVAGSVRGRELRAAAALARLQSQKVVMNESEKDAEDCSEDSGNETVEEAVDINGKKLLDGNGRSMIKICDEDADDSNAQNEILELRAL
jgi:DNA-dependent metalloprotease WSS1